MIAAAAVALARGLGARRLAVAAAVFVTIIGAIMVLHDPFGLRARELGRSRAAAKVDAADARARGLEAHGEAQSAARVGVATQTAMRARAAVISLSGAAARAPDAELPLDPQRLARLRANDAALCAAARLDGCPEEARR